MDRRLSVALLILLPVLAIAQPGSFSLPGVSDLQKQLTETSEKQSDGTDNPDKDNSSKPCNSVRKSTATRKESGT